MQLKEGVFVDNTNNTVSVKCTRCGAKASISGNDYFYTCPVCHGQINKEAARKNYLDPKPQKNVSDPKVKIAQKTTKATTRTPAKSEASMSDTGALILGLFVILLLIVFFIVFPFIGLLAAIGIICAIVHYRNEKNGTNEKRRQKEFEQIGKEYEEAVESQKAEAPWAKRYSTHPCPHCGHYKVRAANWDDKRYSVTFWGAASSKIGKHYKCDHCGNMWS